MYKDGLGRGVRSSRVMGEEVYVGIDVSKTG